MKSILKTFSWKKTAFPARINVNFSNLHYLPKYNRRYATRQSPKQFTMKMTHKELPINVLNAAKFSKVVFVFLIQIMKTKSALIMFPKFLNWKKSKAIKSKKSKWAGFCQSFLHPYLGDGANVIVHLRKTSLFTMKIKMPIHLL
jgi:hypothetical protein